MQRTLRTGLLLISSYIGAVSVHAATVASAATSSVSAANANIYTVAPGLSLTDTVLLSLASAVLLLVGIILIRRDEEWAFN
jgi:hypothetical protein